MRVLVAMSGGVDSSVAAARMVAAGYDTVGATLKLWGGASDSGCCSVSDVDDARRVAQQLGIAHHVFNLAEDFDRTVVAPYVAAHIAGTSPNPCIECNRHIKFERLLARARRLGFDALVTGHHARVRHGAAAGASHRLLRGADPDKDQSYVLSMLNQSQLGDLVLPVGELTKTQVRAEAASLGLRTAGKPDSQDVCFITSTEGRDGFLGQRIAMHPARVIDGRNGEVVGSVEAVELVTVGQRRGMGHGADGQRRYVGAVDVPGRRVIVGGQSEAARQVVALVAGSVTWVDEAVAPGAAVLVQMSAHGRAVVGTVDEQGGQLVVRLAEPQRPVAPGQTVALYDRSHPDAVLGAGIAA